MNPRAPDLGRKLKMGIGVSGQAWCSASGVTPQVSRGEITIWKDQQKSFEIGVP